MSPETTLVAPFAGTVVSVPHGVRESVGAGAAVPVIEAMKMEHEVLAEHDAGRAQAVATNRGRPGLPRVSVRRAALGPGAADAAAVAAAQRYLSYFRRTPPQPAADANAEPPDQTALRDLIPANRKRVYAIRDVIDVLLEDVLELRTGFGPGMVTALARLDGRPLGVIANGPTHLGGAIDADGADKAARFMQLCDAFGLPLLFLADAPGFMVGPETEKTATVRHFSRMFVTGANLSVPTGTVVLRKGYGLGAQAMAAGSFKAPLFCVGWPTSEFGAMGLEGAVKLGLRRELEAIESQQPGKRRPFVDTY